MNTGISVYIGLDDYSIENNIKYLNKAKTLGCEYVFSSAHITEANLTNSDLESIIKECDKLNLKLSLDISKPVFEKITLPQNLYALRLDYGFTEEDIIKLSNDAPFLIELNASTIKNDKIKRLIDNGLNASRTRLSFNFYPKLYTGHDIEMVNQKTTLFKSLGFTVCAFIPSHVGFRPPMYEGLPTVETHRKMNLSLAVEELKACGIDVIYFGDAYASDEEIILVNKHKCNEHLITLNLYKEAYLLEEKLNNIFSIRPDLNNTMLRLSMSRSNEIIKQFNTLKRNLYDVTIDNHLFKRYMGELNIILKELPQDERVNVIGFIETTEIVIDNIKKGVKFRFEIKKKG